MACAHVCQEQPRTGHAPHNLSGTRCLTRLSPPLSLVHLRPIHLAWGLPSFLPFHPHTPPDQQGAVHQQNVPPRRLGYPGLAQPERRRLSLKSELELVQSHMAQKPELRGEVGCACVAREVSVERGGMGERGCARRLKAAVAHPWTADFFCFDVKSARGGWAAIQNNHLDCPPLRFSS